MNKLTKEQIKIIAAILIGMIALICFWVFIYGPQSARLRFLKNDLVFTESQISEINKIMQGKELSTAVEELNKQLIQAIGYLPANQEDIIASLSDKARSLGVEIKSISPQKKILLEDRVSGYVIEELPISMSLLCEFRALGKYLNALRNDSPYLVRIKQLQIKGEGEGKPMLSISLEILAYLSKPK